MRNIAEKDAMEQIPVLERNVDTHPQVNNAKDLGGPSDVSSSPQRFSNPELEVLLLRRLISTNEEERRRIAHALEAEIARILAKLVDTLDHSSGEGSVSLPEIRNLIRQALISTSQIERELFPSLLENRGVPAAISEYAERRLTGSGIRFHMRQFGESTRLSSDIEIALFRIAQEAIDNAAAHSAASNALCVLEFADDCVKMRLADDGRGFDTMAAASASRGKHPLGILEMQERTETVGGSFRLRSIPREGTFIRITIPLLGKAPSA